MTAERSKPADLEVGGLQTVRVELPSGDVELLLQLAHALLDAGVELGLPLLAADAKRKPVP